MVPDGAAVRAGERTAYEPDALVYCGPEKPDNEIEVPNPAIVADVFSPGARHIGNAAKLEGYFTLPSVFHYPIVDIEKRVIIHHARDEGDLLRTGIVRSGSIEIDPPGLTMEFEACFNAA